MARTPRLLWNNLVKASASVLAASGAQLTFPVSNVLNATRSRTWRTPVGWVIVTGFNDSLDFTEGTTGDATATITAGTYATGADLAAAIQTAMNAAATDNTYSVSYDGSTKKFTIARATGSDTFGLEWSTGASANAGKQGSCALDLGFDDSADDTGATTYTSDTATYQSRHYLLVDFGAATAFQAWGLVGHNLGSNAEVRRQANATDAWTAPSVNSTTWDSNPYDPVALAFESSEQTYRYVRLVVDDTQNTDGYVELGVPFVGPYLQPDRGLRQGHVDRLLNASDLVSAYDGALFQERRQEAFSVRGDYHRVSRTTRDALKAMEASLGVGGHLIFAMDPQSYPGSESYYGVLTAPLAYTQRVGDGSPPDRYDVGISFRESLA